jgi:hypothetical protein
MHERNLKSGKASSTRKIENFMTALRKRLERYAQPVH